MTKQTDKQKTQGMEIMKCRDTGEKQCPIRIIHICNYNILRK